MRALLRVVRRQHRAQAHADAGGLRGGDQPGGRPLPERRARRTSRSSRWRRGSAGGRASSTTRRARSSDRARARRAQAFVIRVARATGARVTLIAPGRPRARGVGARGRGAWPAMENHARPARDPRRARGPDRAGPPAQRHHRGAAPVRGGAGARGGRVLGALRLALPLSAVTASYATLHQVMLAGGAVALRRRARDRDLRGRAGDPAGGRDAVDRPPDERGELPVRAPTRSTDEIGTLGRSLNVMAGRLREKIQDLEQEQAKITAMLDAMVEGVVAMDGHDHILLMNERARAMFGLGQRARRRQAVPRGRPQRRPARDLSRGARGRPGRRSGGSSRCRARAYRVLGVNAVGLAPGGRRAGRGHGPPRRDRAPPARAHPDRVRGEREPRAAHAADRHPGLSRDPALRRARGARERAALPRDRASATASGWAAC